jgi:uncharacterized membrane protein
VVGVVGAAAGGRIGSTLDQGVDNDFVKDVSAGLKPGKSALFLVGDRVAPAALREVLASFSGENYQTTLSEEVKESVQQALKPGR